MSSIDPFGIFPPFEAFYIDAMLWHSTSAKQSIDDVGAWIGLVRANDAKALELPKDQLFERLQNIVIQAASLSRYLWPSPRKPQEVHTKRASRLRQGLAVRDDSALYNRDLRNGLEHFDEKLDLYLMGNIVGKISPIYVAEDEPVSEVPLHIFKAFYTNPLVFVLLGVRYEMETLVSELNRLHASLLDCQRGGYRLPLPAHA